MLQGRRKYAEWQGMAEGAPGLTDGGSGTTAATDLSGDYCVEEQLDTICMSRTARLWVHCLIISLLIVHLYVQAEREGDWLLHMYALKRMVPYFFSAGHWHYARYIVWHLQDMLSSLPSELQDAFLRGEHVCRHRKGVWNAVFLNQFGGANLHPVWEGQGGFGGEVIVR